MIIRTWAGSRIETRDRHWTIWPLWALGWIRYSWRSYRFWLLLGIASTALSFVLPVDPWGIASALVGMAGNLRAVAIAVLQ